MGKLVRGQRWLLPLSRGSPTASAPTVYSTLSSGMLPSLPYLLSSSLSPSACHHAALTSSHGCAAYPIPPPSCPRVFGWLLRDKISNGDHLRPSSYFIFVMLRAFNLPPKNKKPPPPPIQLGHASCARCSARASSHRRHRAGQHEALLVGL
jgi:hypothetical protein